MFSSTKSTLLLSNTALIVNNHLQNVSKRYLCKSSQRPRVRGGHYRLWSMPGDLVYRKELLAKQSNIKWHPGLNVGIDDNKSIYALCDGVIIITEDKFNPDWDHPLVNHYYKDDEHKRAPLYMRYIHVIPKKRVSEFKLVDLV